MPGGSAGKESTCNVGDLGLIPGLGRSPGGGHSNPLQYSCLENPHGQRNLVWGINWAPSLDPNPYDPGARHILSFSTIKLGKPIFIWASQVVLVIKNPPTSAGDIRNLGLIPGLGRSPGGGHDNPLQYSCLDIP